MIACIGWGSLIWNTGSIDVDGHWRADGPLIPVEFARQSDNGLITLVVVEGCAQVIMLWSVFNTRDLAAARESLRRRERILPTPASRFIADWRRGDGAISEPAATISRWAAGKDLEAAVWTNLPPKFNGIKGRVPTENEVIAYLQALKGETRAAAELYVRRTPRQIATAYRRAIRNGDGLDVVGLKFTACGEHRAAFVP